MQIEQAPSVSLWNENKSITQTNTFYKRCKQYKYGDHYIHNVLNRQAVFVAASKDNCIGRVFPCENSKTDPRIYIQIFFFRHNLKAGHKRISRDSQNACADEDLISYL